MLSCIIIISLQLKCSLLYNDYTYVYLYIEQKMGTPTKTAALTAQTCTVTQQKSEITVPEVTVSQSEITMPKIRKISIASEMIRSPLMIMMFALLITVIFIYVVFDINWSNVAFYFDRYVETEFL